MTVVDADGVGTAEIVDSMSRADATDHETQVIEQAIRALVVLLEQFYIPVKPVHDRGEQRHLRTEAPWMLRGAFSS